MIPGAYTTSFIPDPDARPQLLPAVSAYLQTGALFTAILDELASIVKAEAAALLTFGRGRPDMVMELGRGDWERWTGRRIPVDRNLLMFMSTPGEIMGGKGWNYSHPFPLNELHGTVQQIFQLPLFFGGHHLGVLWLGHHAPIDPASQLLISSIGNVLASTLYTSHLEPRSDHEQPETVQTLVRKLAVWDTVTFNHSLRMVPWAKATAITLGCTELEIRTICWATLLHDIGKLSIPKQILYKPGKLTLDEWAVMRLHPSVGGRMVSAVNHLSGAREIVATHHEKVDGSGYPYGLKNNSIPLGARILAVVDAYAAMTEDRKYKKTFNHHEALEEIHICTGAHFDPDVSRAFIQQFS